MVEAKEKLNKLTRGSIQGLFLAVLRLFVAAYALWAIWRGNQANAIQAALLLATTYVPYWFIERRFRIKLPIGFHFSVALLLFAGIFAGTILRFYHLINGWDTVIHTAFGGVLGLAGFLVLYTLRAQKRLSMSLKLIAMFAFCAGLAASALWEIGEFTTDVFLHTGAQFGLTDTMIDLISGSLGSVFVSVIGYHFMRHQGPNPLRKLILSFEHHNPQLFGDTRKVK